MCRLIIVLIDNCADQRGLERAAAAIPLIDHCAKIAQKMKLQKVAQKMGAIKLYTETHRDFSNLRGLMEQKYLV